MGRKQRERLVVFNQIKQGQLCRRAVAEVLGLSLRQIQRLYLQWLREGDAGLLHRGCGKASIRKKDAN